MGSLRKSIKHKTKKHNLKMSRKKAAAPKPEELIQTLDDKLEAFKAEILASLEEKANDISKLQEENNEEKNKTEGVVAELKEEISQNKEENTTNCKNLQDTHGVEISEVKNELKLNMDSIIAELKENLENKISQISRTVASESSSTAGTQDQIQELLERVDDINEKMYDFEVNKRNNLIFYGITGEQRETAAVLLSKVVSILRGSMAVKREISLMNASRLHTGPEVAGCRPVVVTFEEFKDREDILRKANMLKGSNIHVTEDMSRRVRESRNELRKFMRDVKRGNPAARVVMQYDKLYVDNKCYIWNDVQGRVTEHMAGDRPGSVLDRSSSVMSFKSMGSPNKRRVSPG